MTDEVHRRLSAALQAQASGLSTGSSLPAPAPAAGSSGRKPAHAKPTLSASTVLALAVLLGLLAGGLAGLISAW
ncbi:MAG TPA: hypothetical protein VE155_08710 [Pseudonocardiaceae bacterium]|nr:hypothetical protein [Pseudonocardiaceae bacterium]